MDLYHRLNVIHIHVAPLIERKDDITMLSETFCEEICTDYGMPVKKITMGAHEALKALPWTGNIRELRNVIERLIILSEKTITEDDVRAFSNPSGSIYNPTNTFESKSEGFNFDNFSKFQDFKDNAEMEFIKFKLEKNNWNVSKTAEDIDIQRSHLYSKIEKFGLKRNE
jgi:two-component system nitrogen regulation response regulator NtrX